MAIFRNLVGIRDRQTFKDDLLAIIANELITLNFNKLVFNKSLKDQAQSSFIDFPNRYQFVWKV